MGTFIKLTADDGHGLDAYRADPVGQAKAGLLVIQEIFGVNDHIRDVCDGFAADGYQVVAPALFDRLRPNVELAYTAETVAEGREMKGQVGWDDPVTDMKAGLAALREAVGASAKVGVVGYCWGGSLSWLAACRLDPACAVGYYGGQIIDFVNEQPGCPTMLHFGTEDAGIPLDDVETIRGRHPDVGVYIYEGAGHGFNCDRRADFHPEAAKLARTRTLEHIAQHLG